MMVKQGVLVINRKKLEREMEREREIREFTMGYR
jgi:hypothetical protein